MEKEILQKQFQKYQPFILIAATLAIGVFLLSQKGIISLPTFGKKANQVSLKPSVVDIIFSGKEYKLSYQTLDKGNVVSIAKFDKSETWQGQGSIEEGATKDENLLSLIDRNRQKTTAFILKNLDLSGVDIVKFAVSLKSDPDNLESLNLIFGNRDLTSFYRFPVTNLKDGLNYFAILKYRFFLSEEKQGQDKNEATSAIAQESTFGWDKIEKVQLELISRPSSKANIEVGWIRGEKEDIFTSDWSWIGDEQFLNLDTSPEGKVALLVQNIGGGIATLRKIGSVKDFSYKAKITPVRKGVLGLFFRGDYRTSFGYYLTSSGLKTGDWTLSKFSLVANQPQMTVLTGGQIGNFAFTSDQPFWLKVVTRVNNISAYFSLDDKEYTKLGEVNDNEFASGGVGLVVSGGAAGYFDDFYLNQK